MSTMGAKILLSLRVNKVLLLRIVAAETFDNLQTQLNTVIISWGSGKLIISILGKFDGLPSLG